MKISTLLWTTLLIRVLSQLVWEIDPYNHLDMEEFVYGMIIAPSIWLLLETLKLLTSLAASVAALWVHRLITAWQSFGRAGAVSVFVGAVVLFSGLHAMGWVLWQCSDRPGLDFHGHTCLQRTLVFLK